MFLLDGEPLCFVGTNNYYLTYKPREMVDDVLDTAQAMGLEVLRHWAFIDRGALDGSVPEIDEDGVKDGHYLQYWDEVSGGPAYNDGASGLEKLDYVMYKARRNGIRVVLVLTNNWREFGGMDQYLTWFGSSKHHEFYTDARVKRAYKDYVGHLLNRVNRFTGVAYKDDPFVFAWGLANEPRMRNFASYDDFDGWQPDTVTQWAREMTEYIRAIDPHHLISVGDEGFYMNGEGPLRSGEDGVNHEALIALEDVDYTTFHLYPDHWSQSIAWGERWIEDHAVSARRVGKPAVLEEYNVAVRREPRTQRVTLGAKRRATALERWHQVTELRGVAGAMFWMLAGYDHQAGAYYPDYDRFTVYAPQVDPTGKTMQRFAARMSRNATACRFAREDARLREPKRLVPPGFVTTSKPERVLEINRQRLLAR